LIETAPALKNDREIFMQRLELDGFEERYKNDVYSKLPDVFRNDKEVMLKVVSKSSKTLSLASNELQNDRDVVMAAVQSGHSCAPHAIQYASKKLQNDKRIVLAVLGHEYGITAFTKLPDKLQRDYKLALWAIQSSSEACSESFEHLSVLSEEMLDDYEIVYEAVKRRGSNLRFVTDKSLLEDIDIVMAACEQDGAAIEYCPMGDTRDELLEDDANLIVLIENGGHCVLKELGEEYMLQSKYLIPAVKSGMLLPADFAAKLYEQDRPLFMDVLLHTSKPFAQYYKLPEDIRSDSSVGMAILKRDDLDEGSWAFRFSKEIPEDVARSHIDALMKLAKEEHVRDTNGSGIWDEKAIAVALCKINGENYSRVSSRLKSDVDVAKAACTGKFDTFTLKQIPQTLLRSNHNVAAMALKACATSSNPGWHVRSDVYRHFGQQVMSCRAVFLEWIRKGWPTRHQFGRTIPFFHDSGVALEAIKNCESENVGDVLSEFSSRVRGDKAFMVSAVQANPEVLHCASADLLHDFDFMLRGISVSKDVLKPFSHKDREFDQLADFAAEVRERLEATDGFILDFFGAVSISPSNRKRSKRRRTVRGKCNLRMLDLGYETGSVIKRMICEYADIPVGPELKLLRAALENLEYWGY
jgi:hypothetical protein